MSITSLLLAAALCAPTSAQAMPAGNVSKTVTIHRVPGVPDDAITMADLAAIPEAGVTDLGDGVYSMIYSLEIPAEMPFSIEGVKTLMMGNDVSLQIDGAAWMDATFSGTCPEARVTVTRLDEDARPLGIRMSNDTDTPAIFRNIDFEYVQLANGGDTGFDVQDCTFTAANGALSSMAAVAVGHTDAVFHITGCTFTSCEVPAIGAPANQGVDLTIEDCIFIDNNTSNTNKPQLNLTVGGDHDLTIRRCILTGTGRDKVGGIAVGNLTVMGGANRVYIEGCTITGHRYGITGVGPMYMEIRDNVLLDNCHDPNPMTGGSGISLAGYGYGLDAIISGNRIERSLWGVTLIQCREVNMGEVDNPASPGGNTFKDNGNNGLPYDLYNNQSADVYAQLNTWSVPEQTADEIEKVIYHRTDDATLGEVIYMPASSGAGIRDALSAPTLGITGNTLYSQQPASLYRADGTQVASCATSIDLSDLAPGIYIATDGIRSLKFKR